MGYNCAVVVVEEGNKGYVWGARWVQTGVVLIAEGQVIGEREVASGVALQECKQRERFKKKEKRRRL
jgi:hypothetical protein